jgi:hypothetical protein
MLGYMPVMKPNFAIPVESMQSGNSSEFDVLNRAELGAIIPGEAQ